MLDFPDSNGGKESTCIVGDARDVGSIPGWGRSPGGGPNARLATLPRNQPGRLSEDLLSVLLSSEGAGSLPRAPTPAPSSYLRPSSTDPSPASWAIQVQVLEIHEKA